ncbi:DUF4097 family beta strand repeat-containing protein [Furfurilactobacillus siliginis]|uniref:DUF4097 domain-containing protein n=1 Tax=Furfurilactobacillus siliginis TaxID=348151 RepID=A0A0R2LD30_9LACO|nr:DUF4097 family beta strand repeat-containing protein [Furfurilactobacillus siliginis]KRN97116.1 hypothetical protein IV55_GL000029 [Furfurilactobacillus siliginis]GEK29392.1 hypothetical protein LSI01_17030 [Furfurilactobacillus siliginis]
MGRLGNFFIHRSNETNKVTIEIGVNTKQPALVNAFSESLSAVDHLAINYSAATIVVRATERPELSVREYMLVDEASYYAHVSHTGSRLSIIAGDRPAQDNLNIRIEVDVPTSYQGRLEISSVSGTIKLNGLHDLRSLAITSTSGNIEMDDLSTTGLTIDSVTGNLKGKGLVADDYTINAMSGNVHLLNSRGNYFIRCSAGSLRLDDAHGHGKFEVTSGTAKLCFAEVDGNLAAESSAGSVRLQVPRELDYGFNLETSIGRLKTPDNAHFSNNERSYQTGAVGEPSELMISMLTVVGSLTLEPR